MSMQIQIQKALSQVNFLESTPLEKHDLTNMLRPGDRFVVRQGDLVVSSHWIDGYRKRGLRALHVYGKNKIHRVLNSHVVIPLEGETILLHPEHGITIIPKSIEKLDFYTFIEGGD